MLGIHRPYFSENDLRELSSDQAILAASGARRIVENYLKEMSVPFKYIDQMSSIPKNQIRWISEEDFDADFEGIIPELKDWIDARCDKRTDVEKQIWEKLKNKNELQQSPAERIMIEAILKKSGPQAECEGQLEIELAVTAYQGAKEKRLSGPHPNSAN